MINLTTFLNQSSLVLNTTPSATDFYTNIQARSTRKDSVRVMYGETYDRLGPTLDSLKYYFSIAAIGHCLRMQGISTDATILVADVATCRNEPNNKHEELMLLGKERVDFIQSINQVYNLGLKIVLMSEYLFTDDFQRQVARVRSLAEVNKDVFGWIKQTVPVSKIEIENEKGFAYAFDEVATIISYDIKVGPPREVFYDEPARLIGRAMGFEPLQCIYLHPTYPLGLSRGFFLNNEEIVQYGVTPYKAGSKNLEANRFIIGQTTIDYFTKLVDNTTITSKPTMPNSIFDLVIIGEMACQWLEGSLYPIDVRERFFNKLITVDDLKQMAIDNIVNYVIHPLKSLT